MKVGRSRISDRFSIWGDGCAKKETRRSVPNVCPLSRDISKNVTGYRFNIDWAPARAIDYSKNKMLKHQEQIYLTKHDKMIGMATFLTKDKINIRESPYACITYIMNNTVEWFWSNWKFWQEALHQYLVTSAPFLCFVSSSLFALFPTLLLFFPNLSANSRLWSWRVGLPNLTVWFMFFCLS